MVHTHRLRLVVGTTAGLTLLGAVAQPVVARAAPGVARPGDAGATTYLVRPNDTLSGIAMRFGTTTEALVAANGLRDDRDIVPGQALRIPRRTGPGAEGAGWGQGRRDAHDPARMRGAHGAAVPAGPARTRGPIRADHPVVAPVVTAVPVTPAATSVPAASATGASLAPTPVTGADASGSVAALLTAQAQAGGVDPALVKAVAWQESGWRMITASDGGIGIMQLMPDTVTWAETTLLGGSINPYTPADNVRAGVALLRYYLGVFGNDERLAIAAYHQGLQGVRTQGVSAEAARYVANVLALQGRFAR